MKRIHAAQANWAQIWDLIKNWMPSVEQMEQTIGSLGGALRPRQVGIPQDMFYDSVCTAKEVRDRYTILQLLWDLGLIEEYAREITKYMYQ